MHRIRSLTVLAASLVAITLLPDTAQAKRKSPLEGKPVVVRKLELRKLRFGITPFVGMSLSQTFVHKGYAGGKLHFDFTDWIGIQAKFAYGVINRDAKLLKALNDESGGLPRGIPPMTAENQSLAPARQLSDFNSPAPLLHDFQSGLTRNNWLASFDVVFKPFSGKLGLFSGIFTEYDMYLFAGLGLANFGRHYPNAKSTTELLGLPNDPKDVNNYCRPTPNSDPNSECYLHPVKADTGIKVGPSFGGGVNIFLADFAALNLDVHDIMTYNNAAGLNSTTTDVPPKVDKQDANWNHNVMFSLGVTFYFPPKAKRSQLKIGGNKPAGAK
ncbi:outer membrane beta-barrel domain-containing protein [Nannocystis sp. SCPEA4]|uniref:outer membrane beta-barrel domain-containing protein n=1 Tax=Nannocystis sp. SCPEA4 TaxID=2996787 RepID=UPI00226E42C7|nr:outer membrane beta-barrel domain-containing protein [Nannocystis sp. SCPEA4]MCY1057788.1 outer membrane beta-barrel domain-containing protein [Nannocystis sp. SCPEA4]